MSIVVLEAGVAGTPVLITDQCGFDEVARIGGGHVVPATIDGLQAGLLSLLKDSTKLNSMGEKLRQFVRANYGWDRLVDQYLELYDKLIPLEIRRETTHSDHRSLRVCG
jgi:glycosyltransferase involved in cell wall biosynthesis